MDGEKRSKIYLRFSNGGLLIVITCLIDFMGYRICTGLLRKDID